MNKSFKPNLFYTLLRFFFSNTWIHLIFGLVLGWIFVVFRVPFWLFLFFFIALSTLNLAGVMYVSMNSIFTKEGQLKSIPEKKFTEVVKELDLDARKIKELGFEQISSFHRNAGGDIISYIFKHQQDNIYCSLSYVCFGSQKKFVSAVFTEFNSDIHLETASVRSAKSHVPPRFYFQMIGSNDANTLLDKHKQAMELFTERGHTPVELKINDSYNYFTQLYKEFSEYAMKGKFWAFKMIFLTPKENQRFFKTIKEQLDENLTKIPVI